MHVIVNSGGGPTLLSKVTDGCFRDMSKMLNKVKLGGSAIDNDRAKCRRTPTFVVNSFSTYARSVPSSSSPSTLFIHY